MHGLVYTRAEKKLVGVALGLYTGGLANGILRYVNLDILVLRMLSMWSFLQFGCEN